MMPGRSRIVRYVCLGVALVAAAGCGGKSSSSTSASAAASSQTSASFDFGNNDPRKVVAFGDSITFGVLELKRRGLGLSTSNNYPNLLEGKLKRLDSAWQVINEGKPGERSFEGAARIGSVLRSDKPGYILIMEGANDAQQCDDTTVLVNSLMNMVLNAKANKTIPIIGTITPSFRNNPCANDTIDDANAGIRGIASAQNIILAEIFNGMNQRELFGQSPDRDPLHPNDQGYAVMADIWYNALLPAVPGGIAVALRRRH
jgi:acyl-CoA thioesterase-1